MVVNTVNTTTTVFVTELLIYDNLLQNVIDTPVFY